MIHDHSKFHRRISIIAGAFIGLVACLRLFLRLINSYSLIEYSFWYLLYLVVPQAINLGVATVLFRGKRDKLAGGALLLNVIYIIGLSFLLVHLVNTSTDYFRLMASFNVFTVISAIIYLLAALDCILPSGLKLGKLRIILVLLPVIRFLGIIIWDTCAYIQILGDACSLGTLFFALLNGMPGLTAELISGVLIGLSLYVTPKNVPVKQ